VVHDCLLDIIAFVGASTTVSRLVRIRPAQAQWLLQRDEIAGQCDFGKRQPLFRIDLRALGIQQVDQSGRSLVAF
jgi:hypothetical protein